jgi:hypothetical protein
MLVEYMSSPAAGPLYFFEGGRSSSAKDRIPAAKILRLCAYQTDPAIILGFFVAFAVINCGLCKLHGAHWEA